MAARRRRLRHPHRRRPQGLSPHGRNAQQHLGVRLLEEAGGITRHRGRHRFAQHPRPPEPPGQRYAVGGRRRAAQGPRQQLRPGRRRQRRALRLQRGLALRRQGHRGLPDHRQAAGQGRLLHRRQEEVTASRGLPLRRTAVCRPVARRHRRSGAPTPRTRKDTWRSPPRPAPTPSQHHLLATTSKVTLKTVSRENATDPPLPEIVTNVLPVNHMHARTSYHRIPFEKRQLSAATMTALPRATTGMDTHETDSQIRGGSRSHRLHRRTGSSGNRVG
ncbi:hypothetical protein SCOCK_290024 [Actinacidiphila cocklensis]|uniref:Uncharacterized protein n=1 Tax=Actinacidiphila cocklensis TaxID=887465 RepID=A0A9W4E7N2_9ACTN|nr:hypothetical protein SCOCK_290024 [Actinacidiphila cocklensis]